MRILFLLITLQFTYGCASYINKFHRQFDAESGRPAATNSKRSDPRGKDRFDFYRNPRNPNGMVSSRARAVMRPKTKRMYQNSRTTRKRYKAADLYDNGSDGSLWQSNASSGFLFGVDTIVSSGDIVVINVQKDLKGDISGELKRAFPTRIRRPAKKKPGAATAKKGADPKAAAGAPAADAAAGDDQKEEVGETKIYDKISGIVIEEINTEHLLLKGRKYLLYRGQKRTIEIQALVARRDLRDDKTINSDDILESTLRVVR